MPGCQVDDIGGMCLCMSACTRMYDALFCVLDTSDAYEENQLIILTKLNKACNFFWQTGRNLQKENLADILHSTYLSTHTCEVESQISTICITSIDFHFDESYFLQF